MTTTRVSAGRLTVENEDARAVITKDDTDIVINIFDGHLVSGTVRLSGSVTDTYVIAAILAKVGLEGVNTDKVAKFRR